ncbi:MAG: signal peptidase II [Flexilinea sp.]
MNKKLRTYLELIIIAGIVVVIDQITKYFIRTNLQLRETWMPWEWLEPYARIIHWKNTGVAFGLFQGRGWLFTVIGLLVVMLIILFYRQTIDSKRFWRIALAFQLGGALGNLIDRVNPGVGYVVDFIWIGNFPVFNLADLSIVCGAVILIIGMWTTEEKEKKAVNEVKNNSEVLTESDTSEQPENSVTKAEVLPDEPTDQKLPELPGLN